MSEVTQSPTRPRARRFGLALPLLIFAVLAGLFWYALHGGDPSLLPSALIGKSVPDFTLPPLEGLSADGKDVPGFASSDLAQGEPTIVNVFASWCVECQVEHPLLLALAKQPGHQTVTASTTRTTRRPRDASSAATAILTRASAPTCSGRTAIDFGVYGVPETYVVTRRRQDRLSPCRPSDREDASRRSCSRC